MNVIVFPSELDLSLFLICQDIPFLDEQSQEVWVVYEACIYNYHCSENIEWSTIVIYLFIHLLQIHCFPTSPSFLRGAGIKVIVEGELWVTLDLWSCFFSSARITTMYPCLVLWGASD